MFDTTERLLARAQRAARLGSFEKELPEGPTAISTGFAAAIGIDERFFTGSLDEALELVHREDRAELARAFRATIGDGEQLAAVVRVARLDGTTAWLSLDGAREVAEDGRALLVGVVQDVTERRELEERLRHAERLETVGRLAGGIAHDFNNLLTVIGGNAQLALQAVESPETVASLSEIIVAVRRAGDLTRSLLDFSRSGDDHRSVLDLNEVVADARQLLPRLIEERVQIEIVLSDEPALVFADRARVDQILLNLAANARDAMPDGGRLSIRISTTREHVRLEVEDDGAGMDETVRERVFDPFYTTKPAGRGTGLGLASTYGTVTQAGGTIEVASEPGVGTTFTILLPRAAPAAPAPDLRAVPAAPAPPGRPRRLRALVVEDEPQLRALTAKTLEGDGYAVAVASDGVDALRILEEDGEPFDIMLSDVHMPVMAGRALLEELDARGTRIPIVFASGYDDASLRSASGDGRPIAFLHKPFSAAELSAAFRTLLDARAA